MEIFYRRPICVFLPGMEVYLTSHFFQGSHRPPRKHTHPCYEIVCTRRDDGVFFHITPPLTEHYSKAKVSGAVCSFLFSFKEDEPNDICQVLSQLDHEIEIKDTFDGISRLESVLDAITHSGFGVNELISAELRLFFVKLAQLFYSENESASVYVQTLDDERIVLLEEFFNVQVRNPDCSKQQLAAKIGVCERQLTRILKETYNSTFSAILLNSRMNMAQAMLMHRDATLEEIAESVGYTSVASFRKAYKNFFGAYPKKE